MKRKPKEEDMSCEIIAQVNDKGEALVNLRGEPFNLLQLIIDIEEETIKVGNISESMVELIRLATKIKKKTI